MQLFAKLPLAAIAICLALSGCVTPEQAQVNRDARLATQFPDPADRVGMYIVFRRSTGFDVEYLPAQISEAVALSRTSALCRRTGLGSFATLRERLPAFSRTVILGDGSSAQVEGFRSDCQR